MSSLVFLDLETTGLDEKDRICELSVIIDEESKLSSKSSLCKPSKKISTEAMSIHHITNEMLKDMPKCIDTVAYNIVEKLNKAENIFIGHNISFDIKMLEKEGLSFNAQYIDTLRCTRSLIPECDMFNLQYLRYELDLYKEENSLAKDLDVKIQAHSSMSDALHVKLLYQNLTQYATLSQLVEISSKPILLEKFSFGKYSGRYIEEIIEIDANYIAWMRQNIEDMDEDLKYTLSYYMR